MEPIPLRVRDDHNESQPGDCWRYTDGDEEGRECWWIVLPDTSGDVGKPGHPGRLSWRTTDRASDPPHLMWDVVGTPPELTVTPSIDVLRYVPNPDKTPGVPSHIRDGSYFHGFITDGMIHL